MKLLIADDEKPLTDFLARGLSAEGYQCVTEHELFNLTARVKQDKPDILILDRMFGQQDSISVLENLKSLPEAPMVLLLTAVDDVRERVQGLKAGADDYLCKPFDFDELLARIIALGRRVSVSPASTSNLELGGLRLDLESRIVYVCGQELLLTRLEFQLLQYLVESADKVLSRERIISRVWQSQSDPMTNVVDVYISRLRQKIPEQAGIDIETLRGNGYRLTYREN